MPTRMIKAATAADPRDLEAEDALASVDLDAAHEIDGGDDAVAEYPMDGDAADATVRRRWSASSLGTRGMATLFGVVAAVVLTAVVGWLGYQNHQERQAVAQRAEFLQAGRQTAVNLTTIDWQHADSDVKRIVDGASGSFYDDFSQRAQPFVDVVKKTQSVSVGTVTAAGVESSTPDDAQVLVAVSVQTTNASSPQQEQRSWRMRLAVQKVGNAMLVSHVEFVA